jgi:ribonuclease J
MEIICYGGVSEIGGNKILICDKDTKLFLDFGKNYSKEKKYYDPPYLQARCTEHLLELGILPNISGLYKLNKSYVKKEEHDINGVLISHPHGDHYDYTRFLKDNIKIHCGEISKEIIIARECSGTKGPTSEYYMCNLTKSKGYEYYKKYQIFKSGNQKKVGDIKYRPIHVDHSVHGAYGYLLETNQGIICYSGDFRLHGPRSYMTFDFINEMKKENIEVLIIEGTNIDSSKISSENEVKEKSKKIIEKTNGLVLVGFSVVDFDRFQTFYKIAKETRRKYVITLKQAYILNKIKKYRSIPKITDDNIFVFLKDKKTYNEFEKEIIRISGIKTINSNELNKIQKNVLIVSGFYDFNELIKIKPIPGSIYILSQSEPFNEEMEIDHGKLKNWLELYGLPLYNIHTSGHATADELKYVIGEVKPKKLILIHTERPYLYKRYVSDLGIKTIIPKENQSISI